MNKTERKMKEIESAAISLGMEKVYRALPLRMFTKLNEMHFDFSKKEDIEKLEMYLLGFKHGVSRGFDDAPMGTL